MTDFYWIHNRATSASTALLRSQSNLPRNIRIVQMGIWRFEPSRPQKLSQENVLKNLEALRKLSEQGLLEVFDAHQNRVLLKDGLPLIPTAKAPLEKPEQQEPMLLPNGGQTVSTPPPEGGFDFQHPKGWEKRDPQDEDAHALAVRREFVTVPEKLPLGIPARGVNRDFQDQEDIPVSVFPGGLTGKDRA